MKPLTIFVLFVLAASIVHAAEEKKPFHRKANVALLGYDPEQSIASQCEARANDNKEIPSLR